MTELLKNLQQASAALAAAVEPEQAENLLLEELRRLCRADLSLLYRPLTPQHWRMISFQPEQTFGLSVPTLDVDWSGETTGEGNQTGISQLLQSRQALLCADPLHSRKYNFRHLSRVEAELGQKIVSVILLPLAERNERAEQIVELLRFAGHGGEGFLADELYAASILTQQAASGLSRIQGRQELSELFESLIQLIGSAIDEKSPFAGDHCRRVPVLAMMLARAVSRSEIEPFREVRFSEADLYELEIAAWLHDIGKLITPIHISDKSTKLERTFDRFDLVRTRFEILRRDLEIARLRAGLQANNIELTDQKLDDRQMLDDLRFLADCNRGRTSLDDTETDRVREIAKDYRWVDRQGDMMPVLTEDETANLMVVRGTLTDAERDMIHQHAISTINMLDMLPFPPNLARVAKIAGSHHENYNGQGFPSGLSGGQMLLQARILALADRFESISSGSRPYKVRNSLDQSLMILRDMVDLGEVDPDLFRLLVAERLYERYAIEFLPRDQIDVVDREALLKDL